MKKALMQLNFNLNKNSLVFVCENQCNTDLFTFDFFGFDLWIGNLEFEKKYCYLELLWWVEIAHVSLKNTHRNQNKGIMALDPFDLYRN